MLVHLVWRRPIVMSVIDVAAALGVITAMAATNVLNAVEQPAPLNLTLVRHAANGCAVNADYVLTAGCSSAAIAVVVPIVLMLHGVIPANCATTARSFARNAEITVPIVPRSVSTAGYVRNAVRGCVLTAMSAIHVITIIVQPAVGAMSVLRYARVAEIPAMNAPTCV